MQCLKCQHDNRAGVKLCRQYGTTLELILPQCQHPKEPDARSCDQRGAKLEESAPSSQPVVSIPGLEDTRVQLQSLIADELANQYVSAEQQFSGENQLMASHSRTSPILTDFPESNCQNTCSILCRTASGSLWAFMPFARNHPRVAGSRFCDRRFNCTPAIDPHLDATRGRRSESR